MRIQSLLRFTLPIGVCAFAVMLLPSRAWAADPGGKPTQFTGSADTNQWRLVWSDEFDDTGLPDAKKWDYEEGFIRNEEPQYYTKRKENVRVENGTLVIEVRKEKYPNARYKAGATGGRPTRGQPEFADYTSASLNTWKTATWQF